MAQLAVRGGTVIDQLGERRADVLIDGNRIVAVGDNIEAANTLDASGCVVCPGFVDLHAHLRDPGQTEAEDIDSGSRGAALGGYTAVVMMANTEPALDTVERVRDVLDRGRNAPCAVHSAAAITVGRLGDDLTDFEALYELGVRVFTDDGWEVEDASLMRLAFERSAKLPGAVLAQHSECTALVEGGQLNEGDVAKALGLRGRPAEAEEITVARDLALARLTGGRLHVQHSSTGRTTALIREARSTGVTVTAEVTPHHLVLTHDACASGDTNFKVNPPLRTQADVTAMRQALAAGTIDAIATDHAPHAPTTKDVPFGEAPPGMLGLETALAVVLTDLVHTGELTMRRALESMSWAPARIGGLTDQGQTIEADKPAELCIFDPDLLWDVDPTQMASKSTNSPFAGRQLRGRVRHTIHNGEPVVIDGSSQQ